jgi:hypothetical protein
VSQPASQQVTKNYHALEIQGAQEGIEESSCRSSCSSAVIHSFIHSFSLLAKQAPKNHPSFSKTDTVQLFSKADGKKKSHW